jgi:hypothetical protein
MIRRAWIALLQDTARFELDKEAEICPRRSSHMIMKITDRASIRQSRIRRTDC